MHAAQSESAISRMALPFAFFNDAGNLVGYDVELAHVLARDLRVRLELVPIDRERIVDAIEARSADVVMAGVAITAERAAAIPFSASYLDETLAFIVPDHRRDEFANWETLRGRTDLTLAAPNLPYYVDLMRRLLPRAQIEVMTGPRGAHALRASSTRTRSSQQPSGAPRGRCCIPEFTVVVPQPGLVRIPLAYPLVRDEEWRMFVDQWLELKRKDGTLEELYAYWILGRDAVERQRRWSILDDVL